jgi:nucleotide-binding universal stress UspA family protein
MLRNILVPIDTSPLSELAARKAAALARSTGATVHLVLVYESPFPAFDAGHLLDAGFLAVDRAHYERQLRRIAHDVTRRSGSPCDFVMLVGAPAETITKHARDTGVDLIVMSTHGRTGVSRAWFGSVADALARQSPIPVLMVRAPENDATAMQPDSDPAFGRVLVALDGSDAAESVLTCLDEARITGQADERLVEIVQPVPLPLVTYPEAGLVASMPPDLDATAQLQKEAEVYLLGVARRRERAGACKVETQACVAPSAGPAIVAIALEWNADLVAINSHGRGASRLVIGSVADKILRGTHASVLLSRAAG